MARSEIDTKREQLRQAARDSIKAQEHITQIVDNIEKLESAYDETAPLDSAKIGALKGANEARFRLLNKVLPDVKSVDHTSSDGSMATDSLTVEQRRKRLAELEAKRNA
jgi:hypothetical protein